MIQIDCISFRGRILAEDLFDVEIIHTQEHNFEIVLRLVIRRETIVVGIECINFFLNRVFGLVEE